MNDMTSCLMNSPVSHGFNKDAATLFDAKPTAFAYSGQYGQYIITVNANRLDPIPWTASSDTITVILLRSRRGNSEAVVTGDE